jgi:hypothetical protein
VEEAMGLVAFGKWKRPRKELQREQHSEDALILGFITVK